MGVSHCDRDSNALRKDEPPSQHLGDGLKISVGKINSWLESLPATDGNSEVTSAIDKGETPIFF